MDGYSLYCKSNLCKRATPPASTPHRRASLIRLPLVPAGVAGTLRHHHLFHETSTHSQTPKRPRLIESRSVHFRFRLSGNMLNKLRTSQFDPPHPPHLTLPCLAPLPLLKAPLNSPYITRRHRRFPPLFSFGCLGFYTVSSRQKKSNAGVPKRRQTNQMAR